MARHAGNRRAAEVVGQLELFDCFGLPAAPEGLPIAGESIAQEATAYASNDEQDDDPLVTAPIIRRIIPASEASPLNITGPASIFDMQAPVTVKMERRQDAPTFREVIRDGDVVRCKRLQEQDTTEWQEREAARRARQRPPKPSERAKTKSKKLLELVGA